MSQMTIPERMEKMMEVYREVSRVDYEVRWGETAQPSYFGDFSQEKSRVESLLREKAALSSKHWELRMSLIQEMGVEDFNKLHLEYRLKSC